MTGFWEELPPEDRPQPQPQARAAWLSPVWEVDDVWAVAAMAFLALMIVLCVWALAFDVAILPTIGLLVTATFLGWVHGQRRRGR